MKIVKRTAGVSEKPKEAVLPIKEDVHKETPQRQQLQAKKETQTPTTENTTASVEKSSTKQKQTEEPQQNIWEKRKEQLEKQKEPSFAGDEFSDTNSTNRSKGDESNTKHRSDAKRDHSGSHNYHDNAHWNSSGRTNSRGRGMTRGRVRREFVSSRRAHGVSAPRY